MFVGPALQHVQGETACASRRDCTRTPCTGSRALHALVCAARRWLLNVQRAHTRVLLPRIATAGSTAIASPSKFDTRPRVTRRRRRASGAFCVSAPQSAWPPPAGTIAGAAGLHQAACTQAMIRGTLIMAPGGLTGLAATAALAQGRQPPRRTPLLAPPPRALGAALAPSPPSFFEPTGSPPMVLL